jgi:hypothetical protein
MGANQMTLTQEQLTELKAHCETWFKEKSQHALVTSAPALIAMAEQSLRFDLAAHLQRQREFSEKTWGPGARTKGVIDHIRKELNEIAAEPDSLAEWIDVATLALDGAWRAGYSPDQIIAEILANQDGNEARTWPDWRTANPDKAIEHDRTGE